MSPWRSRDLLIASPPQLGGRRSPALELLRVAGLRDGFMIADAVLADVLADYIDGDVDHDDLRLALEQHRTAYASYREGLERTERAVPFP